MSATRRSAGWEQWLKPLAVGVIVLVFAYAFAANSAERGLDDPVVRYIALLSDGDFVGARAELCESAQPLATDERLRAAVGGQPLVVVSSGLRGSGIEGIPWITDRAHSYVEVALGDRKQHRTFRMRREHSSWRVCPSSSRELLGR